MEKRKEIDLVNVILCLLVMLIHILSKAVSALDRTSLQFAAVFIPSRLSSFVVQGFIFLSSLKYFMKISESEFNYGRFLVSRIKTIIVPYIIWNIIYYFALMKLGYFIFNPLEIIKYIFTGNMISHFYFVVVIAQFYILMPLWIKLVNNISGKILIPVSLILMISFGQYWGTSFQYNDRIFLKYIFYWICGCYAGLNYNKVINFIKNKKIIITVIFIITACVDSVLTWFNMAGFANIRGLENIHIVYCTLAIIFIFTVSLWKSNKIVDRKIFGVINRQSYNIYLSHCLILYYADWFASLYMSVSNGGILIFRGLCCLGVTIVAWGAYDLIKRRKIA